MVTKEDLDNVLNRTIDFIKNCDNKASIFLGIFGLILSTILTTNGAKSIYNIINSIIKAQSCSSILHLICIIVSTVFLIIGLFYVGQVLVVQVSYDNEPDLEDDSKIFFEHIKKNRSFSMYKQKLLNLTDAEFLNDIISQIYINSKICSNKYRKYKKGVKLSTISFLAFIFFWIIGVIVY